MKSKVVMKLHARVLHWCKGVRVLHCDEYRSNRFKKPWRATYVHGRVTIKPFLKYVDLSVEKKTVESTRIYKH